MSAEEKAKLKESLGTLVYFLPRSKNDLRYFVGLSITAGIVEEILYRGFLFWYLLQFIPVWAAIIMSSVIFGLEHGYQGTSGVARVTGVGLAFGVFYVFTGSIWLPILAHVAVDVLQGTAMSEVLRENDEALAPM